MRIRNYTKIYIIFQIILTCTFMLVSTEHNIRIWNSRFDSYSAVEILFKSTWYRMCYSEHHDIPDEFTSNFLCNKIFKNKNKFTIINSNIKSNLHTHNSLNISCRGDETDISQCKLKIIECQDFATPTNLCSAKQKLISTTEKTIPITNEKECGFKCTGSNICLLSSLVCDGNKDCFFGEDEENCKNYLKEFETHENKRPVTQIYLVEGHPTLNGCARDCAEAQTINCSSFFFRPSSPNVTPMCLLTNENRSRGFDFQFYLFFHYFKNQSSKSITECNKSTEFKCGNNKCVKLSYLCDGEEDCNDGSDEHIDKCNSTMRIRLVDGPDNYSGRVEVRYRGIWGTICDDNWDDTDALVVCKSLGYNGTAKAHIKAEFGTGSGPIWLDEVQCSGSEGNLQECEKSELLMHDCTLEETTGVSCIGNQNKNHIPPLVQQILPSDCGRREFSDWYIYDDRSVTRIVGGRDSIYGAHPWQVGIRLHNGRYSQHTCGGTIISEYFVISAAHCFQRVLQPPWYHVVQSGDFDQNVLEKYEQDFLVELIIIHERFHEGLQFNNDIALLKIRPNRYRRGFQFNSHVGPACLPPPDAPYTAGTKCMISGWGRTYFQQPGLPARLQSAVVPIQSRSTCNLPHVWGQLPLTSGMFCAGELAGGVDSCQGDSGGPFTCSNSGRFTLYGIVSFGLGCATPNKPGVYTVVKNYVDWIYGNLIKYH